MEPEEVPKQLSRAVSGIQAFRNFAEEHSISRMNLCLAYANSISWSDGVIVGVASLAQLKEIVKCDTDLPLEWDSLIPRLPVDILDPRKWKL
jgi:aryl-alcohol dehydrogenase-like predicted oxidoreductase